MRSTADLSSYLPEDIQEYLRDRFASMERSDNERESVKAKADPKAHKLSRVIEGKGGTNYRYYRAGKDGRGRTIYFCWGVHRNVAGILPWMARGAY